MEINREMRGICNEIESYLQKNSLFVDGGDLRADADDPRAGCGR